MMTKNDWHIFRGKDGQWRWHVAAAENGEILASGEGYVDRRDAEKVVARLSGQQTNDSDRYPFELTHDAITGPDDEARPEGLDCA